jgi:transcriptional regulator with XRE-family HTH domain
MAAQPQPEVGSHLREWRERRRLSQMEVALDAGVSSRHLSFVETGRSHPGREPLLRILAALKVPFREQNRLLLAAGHAPAYPERSIDDPDLSPVRDALDQVLTGHDPFPAVAVDRAWNMVAANSAMLRLADGIEVDPELLEPPINIIRIGLHPRGLAPLFANLGAWRAHWVRQLESQLTTTGDPRLAALIDEVASYPTPEDVPSRQAGPASASDPGPASGSGPGPGPGEMLGPVRMRTPDGAELSFFGMFATFDTPFEVTTSELAIELLFPADQSTAERMRAQA